MELFSKQESRIYFSSKIANLKNEVESMSDEQILSCDFEEWVDYLQDKYLVDTIQLLEDNIEKEISETTIKMHNPFYERRAYYEKPYYEMPGYCLTFRMYFDGCVDLLDLQPSSRILRNFPVDRLIAPKGENYGKLEINMSYTKQEFEERKDLSQYVEQQFQREFSSYRTMIGYVNAEANGYNNNLKEIARKALIARKEKASAFAQFSKILEIPLKRSRNAPNTTPVKLKRVNKTPPIKPANRVVLPEYSIPSEDYTNINNIIHMCGSSMERTARTYIAFEEEQLRDQILATLNTHYDNATGETFRKVGKTDILIEFENKAAYIGECKVWHGDKVFAEAIKQLMSYATWRDSKVSLIIFNKHNKSFHGILAKIDEWVKSNTSSHIMKDNNTWICKYYRIDMETSVELCIQAFDLHTPE